MPVQDLVGRRKEAAILEKYYASDKSEFVAVYGRRRVGKTYLVQKIMGDRFDYDFSGLYGTQAKAQRQRFQKALDRRTGSTGQEPANWFDAFDNLKDYLLSLGKERVVVFLDELPWLDTQKQFPCGAVRFLERMAQWENTPETVCMRLGNHMDGKPAYWRPGRAVRQDQPLNLPGTVQPSRDRRVSQPNQRDELRKPEDSGCLYDFRRNTLLPGHA